MLFQSFKLNDSDKRLDLSDECTFEGLFQSKKSQSELGLSDSKWQQHIDGREKKWKTLTSLPLAMAYVTRYLWGTDNIRFALL